MLKKKKNPNQKHPNFIKNIKVNVSEIWDEICKITKLFIGKEFRMNLNQKVKPTRKDLKEIRVSKSNCATLRVFHF